MFFYSGMHVRKKARLFLNCVWELVGNVAGTVWCLLESLKSISFLENVWYLRPKKVEMIDFMDKWYVFWCSTFKTRRFLVGKWFPLWFQANHLFSALLCRPQNFLMFHRSTIIAHLEALRVSLPHYLESLSSDTSNSYFKQIKKKKLREKLLNLPMRVHWPKNLWRRLLLSSG